MLAVGVITSATGAALQDILTVLERRSPHTRVYVFPVPVQGEGAAEQIAAAIHQADHMASSGKLPLDVLIVGRGGGCLLYTSPSPRDKRQSRMPSSA